MLLLDPGSLPEVTASARSEGSLFIFCNHEGASIRTVSVYERARGAAL
jgi:hypothetical protein